MPKKGKYTSLLPKKGKNYQPKRIFVQLAKV
jgi:hypothetical protein